MFKFIIKIFSFLCFFSFHTFSQKEIVLTDDITKIELKNNVVEVFEDTLNRLTFNEIKDKSFKNSKKKDFNYGYTKSKHWGRFKINNKSTKKWKFILFSSLIDEIEFYEIHNNGSISKRYSGKYYPHSTRELDAPFFAFNINIPKTATGIIYFSVHTNDPNQFELYLETDDYLLKALPRGMYMWFIYFGMLFMMAIYNFLLFLSIRDKTYLYYVLYILSFGLFQFTIFGFGAQFIWPSNVWFANRATMFFAGMSTIFIALFSYNFLNIKWLYQKIKFVFFYLIICGIIISLRSMFLSSPAANNIIALISLLNVILMLIIGTLVWKNGFASARFYMIAWGIFLFSIALFILKTTKILPDSPVNFLLLPFGCIVEVIMLSFGLGSRINEMEKDKTNAQKEVVNQLKENENVRGRIARDLHDDLGSTLSSINILSEFAKKESKIHPENIPSILQKINESSRKLQDNLQDIVWTTQNSEHKLESLTSRMRLFSGEILEAKDIDYQIDMDKDIGNINLSSATQYDIFMIFKEAINNIVKYANAQKVNIEFTIFENELRLKIIDNGKGFDLNSEKIGNGLKNMKNRAENIGGILNLRSEIGKGSLVELILPVPN